MRRRNGGASRPRRTARRSGTTRCQRVAEAAFALDFAFVFVRVFVRVEHVEREAVRGLLDDDHESVGRALDRHAGNGLHENV